MHGVTTYCEMMIEWHKVMIDTFEGTQAARDAQVAIETLEKVLAVAVATA